MIFHGRDQIHMCLTRKIRSRNRIKHHRSWSIPPRATKIQIMPRFCGAFSFGLAGWFLGGGSSHLGGNLRFGRNEVSVDDLFLNELD